MDGEKLALLFVGILLSFVGVLLLIGGARVLRKKWLLSQRGLRTKGVVTEVIEVADVAEPGHPAYYPRVRFRAADERRYSFKSDIGSGRTRWRPGHEVDVLYDPDDPSKAELAGSRSWAFPICVLISGAVFLGFAILIFVFRLM